MEKLIGFTRRKCKVEGCNKLGRNKGQYKRQTRYDIYCELHHRARYGEENRMYFYKKAHIDNLKCSNCGWNKAKCDRHRKKAELGYAIENVRVLCPNCHRLAHLGII